MFTTLQLGWWYGQKSVVKLLLEHGANVNATDRVKDPNWQGADQFPVYKRSGGVEPATTWEKSSRWSERYLGGWSVAEWLGHDLAS